MDVLTVDKICQLNRENNRLGGQGQDLAVIGCVESVVGLTQE